MVGDMGSSEFRILGDLDIVPRGARRALLIRHADRDGPLTKLIDDSVSINARGEERAKSFGKQIQSQEGLRLHSSPVGRCVRTCECISRGYGSKVEIQPSAVIGMKGPFILRPKEATQLMTELGLVPFVDAYVKGELDPTVVMPCAEGAQRLISWTSCKMRSGAPGTRIAVTHDLILTPVLRHLFDYDVHGLGLIDFLDGFVLYEQGARMLALYDGKEVDVTSMSFPLYR